MAETNTLTNVKKGFIKLGTDTLLPITRAELVLDSEGSIALHSSLFLATASVATYTEGGVTRTNALGRPGLMSGELALQLANNTGDIVDLKDLVGGLLSEISGIKTDITDINTTIDGIQEEIDDLKAVAPSTKYSEGEGIVFTTGTGTTEISIDDTVVATVAQIESLLGSLGSLEDSLQKDLEDYINDKLTSPIKFVGVYKSDLDKTDPLSKLIQQFKDLTDDEKTNCLEALQNTMYLVIEDTKLPEDIVDKGVFETSTTDYYARKGDFIITNNKTLYVVPSGNDISEALASITIKGVDSNDINTSYTKTNPTLEFDSSYFTVADSGTSDVVSISKKPFTITQIFGSLYQFNFPCYYNYWENGSEKTPLTLAFQIAGSTSISIKHVVSKYANEDKYTGKLEIDLSDDVKGLLEYLKNNCITFDEVSGELSNLKARLTLDIDTETPQN